MKILHVLASGDVGGIEVLCKDIGLHSQNENEFCFLWHGGAVEGMMKDLGLVTYIIGISHTLSISTVKAYVKLKTLVVKNKYDAIVFHHSAPLMWAYLIKLKKENTGAFIVQYAHNHYDNLVMRGSKSYLVRKVLLGKACSSADGVIAISKAVKRSLCDNIDIEDNKIEIIYNGVDIERFKKPQRAKYEKTRVVYVGRITKSKGIQTLLCATHKMKNKNFDLQIAGDGPFLAEAKQYAADNNINCKFVGVIKDVPEFLSHADIFVHPAIWEEGFGIAIVEAMAAGLLCIASKKGAIPEIIDDGKDGILFTSGDADELADILDTAVTEIYTERMEEIRERAVHAAYSFSIEKMVNHIDKYLSTTNQKLSTTYNS